MTTTAAGVPLASIERDTAGSTEQRSLRHGFSRRIAIDLTAFAEAASIIATGLGLAHLYSATTGLPLDWLKHLQTCLATAGIAFFCLKSWGLYDQGRLHRLPVRPGVMIASLTIAFVAAPGLGLRFIPAEGYVSGWYAAWFVASLGAMLETRYIARNILSRLTRLGAFDARVAVYGNGSIARRVEEHLSDAALGVSFAGLFDDRIDGSRLDPAAPKVSGNLVDLEHRARTGEVDRIVIALPQSADARTRQIARRLEHLPVSLHIVTHLAADLIETGPAHAVSNIGPVGLIDVKAKPLADWSRVVKAIEDYALAGLLLIVLLPLFAVIALAIKLDSNGPVLFRQRRRGLNHRVFDVLKFRTMHVLEDGAELKQATRDDPRVTRIGRILRWSSFDELPQLWNVLRGEMSIVGPRPHALAHDDQFGSTVERYVNRQQVKPGITGLAQISGFRGETETLYKIEKRTELDLQYVNSWSLGLDLKILVLTLLRGWCGKNAY